MKFRIITTPVQGYQLIRVQNKTMERQLRADIFRSKHIRIGAISGRETKSSILDDEKFLISNYSNMRSSYVARNAYLTGPSGSANVGRIPRNLMITYGKTGRKDAFWLKKFKKTERRFRDYYRDCD